MNFDTQDNFVDEIRQNINIGCYSLGAIRVLIENTIKANWQNRGDKEINFVLRCLIRGLKDLKNAT